MSVRVYQFAKARSITNKEVVDALADLGVSVSSHMSVIPDQLYSKLEDRFKSSAEVDLSENTHEIKVDQSSGKKALGDVGIGKDAKSQDKEKLSNSFVDSSSNFGDSIKSKSNPINKGFIDKVSSNVIQDLESAANKNVVKSTISTVGSSGSLKVKNQVQGSDDELLEDASSSSSNTLVEDLERAFSSYGKSTANYNEPKRTFKRKKFKPKKVFRKPEQLIAVHVFAEPEVPMSVEAFAEALGRKPADILLFFLRKGKLLALNHVLDIEQIKQFCVDSGIEILGRDKNASKSALPLENVRASGFNDKNSVVRKPVVVIMGHVDHGKTSLLDYIRKSKVADHEHGGITQSITAYEVPVGNGILFIDTPGHEAFSMMRGCGARITDIALILIAADDGIMPQTAESIELAKKSGCQIMVVINKIDKPGVEKNIENIKNQLAQKYGVLIEEWGGDVICCPVSAKTGLGVDHLLEMISLQSEVLGLKARIDMPGKAFVLESRVEKGHGPVASLIVTDGKISKFDFFVCDGKAGKVKSIESFSGKQIDKALPSTIVKIAGFEGMVVPGSTFEVVSAKEWSDVKNNRTVEAKTADCVSEGIQKLDLDVSKLAQDLRIKVLLKAATGGTLDALSNAVANAKKRNKDLDKNFLLIGVSAGEVSSADVITASDFGATIMTFSTTVDRKAQELATIKGVVIEPYKIVYKLIERIEELVKNKVENEIVYKEVGQAEIIQVFAFKGKGVVAGCRVVDGRIIRPSKITCLRDGKVLVQNKSLTSLQHLKKTVNEVKKGLECGLIVDGYDLWAVGDKVVCYQAVKRSES